MNVPARPARMEQNAQMVPTSTHVNVLKVNHTVVYLSNFIITFVFLDSHFFPLFLQDTQGSIVRLTSMNATLTPVTMVSVRMAWPPSLATATLATLAACVRPTSMSV